MMHDYLSRLALWLVSLSRRPKRALLATVDLLVLLSLLWGLISLRYMMPYVPESYLSAALLLAAPIIVVVLLVHYRMYREVTRYISSKGSLRLASVVFGGTLAWALLVLMAGQKGVPRSVVMLFVVMAPAAIVGVRRIAADSLRMLGITVPDRSLERPSIATLVIGAGPLAVQLSQIDSIKRTRSIVAFVDDAPGTIGRFIGGVRVHGTADLGALLKKYEVREAIVALDSGRPSERRAMLKLLEKYPLRVRMLAEFDRLAAEGWGAKGVREVAGRDLLGRSPIPPQQDLLESHVTGKSVLVTGAGGSIGSEIVRQLAQLRPVCIVMLDNSEAALHSVEEDVIQILSKIEPGDRPRLVPVLASIQDAGLVADIIRTHRVQTLFHAAAYKHVPIVERDPIAGIVNNALATDKLARIAIDCGINRFVFVSTDKAVRPTSAMGATKRLAELIVNDLSRRQSRTVFCCVRFGNVLASSGSVVEKFAEQIRLGGPVTVTHPEMVRFFMSVEEAASLVIQAATLAKGGDTFLLEMGEPISILELARSMIRLMGYEEFSSHNPSGDIEISFTGLRPGEKLVEDLLTDLRNAEGTGHPRIMKAHEPEIDPVILQRELGNLRRAIELRDVGLAIAALKSAVVEYRPSASVLELAKPDSPRAAH